MFMFTISLNTLIHPIIGCILYFIKGILLTFNIKLKKIYYYYYYYDNDNYFNIIIIIIITLLLLLLLLLFNYSIFIIFIIIYFFVLIHIDIQLLYFVCVNENIITFNENISSLIAYIGLDVDFKIFRMYYLYYLSYKYIFTLILILMFLNIYLYLYKFLYNCNNFRHYFFSS